MTTEHRIRDALRAVADPAPALSAAGNVAPEPIRVLLVCDEPMVRGALLEWGERSPAVEICGWADGVAAAVLLADQYDAEVLLAVLHPIERLRVLAAGAARPVLALVHVESAWDVERVLRLGVTGALSRRATPVEIAAGVLAVRHGLRVSPQTGDLPPVVDLTEAEAEMVVDTGDIDGHDDNGGDGDGNGGNGDGNGNGGDDDGGTGGEHALNGDITRPGHLTGSDDLGRTEVDLVSTDVPLTNRERQIVQLIVDGYSVKQIATRLGIATQTAKNHVHHVMVKVGASTRLQLYTWARAHGFVESATSGAGAARHSAMPTWAPGSPGTGTR